METTSRTKVTNPFYKRIQKEGIHVIGAPGLAAGRTKVTNPYFNRKGRPRKGAPVDPTTVKSIRLPSKVWAQLDAQARREGKTRHAAMREAVLIWLRT